MNENDAMLHLLLENVTLTRNVKVRRLRWSGNVTSVDTLGLVKRPFLQKKPDRKFTDRLAPWIVSVLQAGGR